jgi:hypothetical protein
LDLGNWRTLLLCYWVGPDPVEAPQMNPQTKELIFKAAVILFFVALAVFGMLFITGD